MIEFVTVITLILMDGNVQKVPYVAQNTGNFKYNFKTIQECEDRLFKWYRDLGGELERGEEGEIIWKPLTDHHRYCVKIEINENDLK